ncbi:MAG: 50S ribosomal protein L35 [Deltaproteobacteria bacterium]|nr:50S ribosomal protein L35 [Deltaproteobacteria bacterium]MCB9788251.1 50S ribosomal protein L35 [Deltaproteobacteria bacterium]
MSKIKTHRGAAKRFRLTGSGKVVRQHANANHILTKKRPKRKRRLRGTAIATAVDAKLIKRMIPHA